MESDVYVSTVPLWHVLRYTDFAHLSNRKWQRWLANHCGLQQLQRKHFSEPFHYRIIDHKKWMLTRIKHGI